MRMSEGHATLAAMLCQSAMYGMVRHVYSQSASQPVSQYMVTFLVPPASLRGCDGDAAVPCLFAPLPTLREAVSGREWAVVGPGPPSSPQASRDCVLRSPSHLAMEFSQQQGQMGKASST